MSRDIRGASTMCIAQVRNGQWDLLNLGDSGLRIIRNCKIIKRTVEQTAEYFGCPYQVGPKGESPHWPEHSYTSNTLQAELGDIVIMGSDGLWDNLFEKDMMAIIQKTYGDLELMAQTIADEARRQSTKFKASPYTEACEKAMREGRLGAFKWGPRGKEDDISVAVGMV